MKKLSTFLLAFLFILGVTACGGGGNDENNADSTLTDLPNEMSEVQQEVEAALYPIPTSFELTQMLNQAGASFILDLANNPANVDKYMTEKQQAINLGVFGADLSYSSTYQQTQQTINFLEASEKLMSSLSISSTFNKTLVERVNTNIDNRDSLVAILTESFHDTYAFLNENGKENLSILIIAGSWVEGNYIATQLASTAPNKTELVKVIAKQKASFDKLIGILEANKVDESINQVYTALTPLKDLFAKVDADANKANLTADQFKTLTTTLEKIRKEMVK